MLYYFFRVYQTQSFTYILFGRTCFRIILTTVSTAAWAVCLRTMSVDDCKYVDLISDIRFVAV